MSLFTEIGAMLDLLFCEPKVKNDDIKERAVELVVNLWETEFDKFKLVSGEYSTLDHSWKHSDFPALWVKRSWLGETKWSASIDGHILPLTKRQSDRLQAVLTKLKNDREIASVEALAAAIIERSKQSA